MKELIVKPSFLSKITVNSEYLEKQLLELRIMTKDIKAIDKLTKVIPVLAAIYFIIRSIL